VSGRGGVPARAARRWRRRTAWLLELVENEPDLTLAEIVERLWQDRGMRTTDSSVGCFFKWHGVTFKKTLRAAEQDRLDVVQARQGWKTGQASLDTERLVFVAETGTSTKMVRTHGRCRRGRRLIGKAPWGHLKTTTFTAGLRRDGLVAPWVLDGPMNGEAFLTYVKERTGFQPRRDRQFARSQSRWGPRCDRGQERNTALPASLFARP
jgi:hypothetical protein